MRDALRARRASVVAILGAAALLVGAIAVMSSRRNAVMELT
jgi:hypothetical protein